MKKAVATTLALLSVFFVGLAVAESTVITYDSFIEAINRYITEVDNSFYSELGLTQLEIKEYFKDPNEAYDFYYLGKDNKWVINGRADPGTNQLTIVHLFIPDTDEEKITFGQQFLLDVIVRYAISGTDDPKAQKEYIIPENSERLNGYSLLRQHLYTDSAFQSSNYWRLTDFDITSITTEQARHSMLSSGEYIVGQHIPAGEYSASTDAISVNLSTRRDGKLRINEVLSPTNPIGRMVLQDGDEIEISGGAVNFKPLQ